MRSDHSLTVVSGVSLGAFAAILALEHVLVPELEPTQHVISEYATADAGVLMTAGFLAWAISLAATAAVARLVGLPRATSPLLVAAALGMVITACFATQAAAGMLPPGVERTTAGRLHDVGSGVTTIAIAGSTVMVVIARSLPCAARVFSAVVLIVALLTATVLLAVGDPIPGVRQRVLVAAALTVQGVLLVAARRRLRLVSRPEADVRCRRQRDPPVPPAAVRRRRS
ncbi:MAG: DUF998 domain-containing protein [Actinomycetota bacterium]|nr:DUF998 domain-containing protein [Actinomycetota bacterium]MDQ5807733.1 DUF998 domain-containing protein [Actinomycetota bacterium]